MDGFRTDKTTEESHKAAEKRAKWARAERVRRSLTPQQLADEAESIAVQIAAFIAARDAKPIEEATPCI